MKQAIKIIQLTDTHLFSNAEGTLAGINTRESYLEVKQQALQQHGDAQIVLHTGDIIQEGADASYQWFINDISGVNKPVYCMPGNHDDPSLMKQLMNVSGVYFKDFVDIGGWRLIFLSTAVSGSAGGCLSEESLNTMHALLQGAEGKFVMVCLHHNPLPMGSEWLDTMTVENGAEFMACLSAYKQVKAVLHGHVHQASDHDIGSIRLLSTPSTCFQFKPDNATFSLDDKVPGYRWLTLHDDGKIDTAVERVDLTLDGLDLSTEGY